MMQRIRRLLEERIGLDVQSLGDRAFEAAVTEAAQRFTDREALAEDLTGNPEEFDRFVQRLIVPETWFFRGAKLFHYLANHIAKLGPTKTVRVLSVPCSTGEEPYSLAMALAEAGVPASRCEIHAMDLSRAAIAAAQRGVYRAFSFRELPPALKLKYFRESEGGWQLDRAILARVRFTQGNVLEPRAETYDVVLCRNLLIYFTPAARRQAMDNLLRMLAPDGLLGVGHAEPAAVADRGLQLVETGEKFLFRRAALPPKEWTLPHAVPLASTEVLRPESREPVAPAPSPSRSLASVQELADRGRLDDALTECRALAAEQSTAEVYALLGLIQQARGDLGAAKETFRKALYLDPKNVTALAMSRRTGGGA